MMGVNVTVTGADGERLGQWHTTNTGEHYAGCGHEPDATSGGFTKGLAPTDLRAQPSWPEVGEPPSVRVPDTGEGPGEGALGPDGGPQEANPNGYSWQDAERFKEDYERVCSTLYEVYCAAMGAAPTEVEFSGEPVKDVYAERARLLQQIVSANKAMNESLQEAREGRRALVRDEALRRYIAENHPDAIHEDLPRADALMRIATDLQVENANLGKALKKSRERNGILQGFVNQVHSSLERMG